MSNQTPRTKTKFHQDSTREDVYVVVGTTNQASIGSLRQLDGVDPTRQAKQTKTHLTVLRAYSDDLVELERFVLPSEPPILKDTTKKEVESHLELARAWFGRATIRMLEQSLCQFASWAEKKFEPQKGSFHRFIRAILFLAQRKFVAQFKQKNLQREKLDEIARDAATTDQDALARFLSLWKWKLEQLQNAFPQAWRVPSMTQEEVRDELELELLRMIRQNELHLFEQVGAEATFVALGRLKDRLRVGRKMYEVNPALDLARLAATPKTPEELYDAIEQEHRLTYVFDKLNANLSRINKEWLEVFQTEAAGQDGKPFSFSRAAKNYPGKNRDRASAIRARDKMRKLLQKEKAEELLESLQVPGRGRGVQQPGR